MIFDLFKQESNSQGLNPFYDIRKHILFFMLIIGILTSFISAALNIINARPLSNIALPIGLACFLGLLYFLSKNDTHHYKIKIIFMVLISNLYIPVGWLASPGSSSAMPLYTLLILVATVLLIEHVVEIVIPITATLEVLVLYQYEALYPERFLPYTDRFYHAFDLSVNYFAISAIIFALLFIVNRYFAREHHVLYNISITDPLTGTYNRRYLFQRLSEIHNLSLRQKQPYSLIMIDINSFKAVNDTFGHMEGDRVLSDLGNCLNSHCRNYDVVGRYGGDEFLIILPNTTLGESELVVTRIHQCFESIALKYPTINLSLGIATTENLTGDLEMILLQIDSLLYAKKHEIKNPLV